MDATQLGPVVPSRRSGRDGRHGSTYFPARGPEGRAEEECLLTERQIKDYETITVHVPTTEDAQVGADLQEIQDLIASKDGEIVTVERWGRKRLAYEIEKFNEGIYNVIRFAAAPDVLPEMDRKYRLNERLLRHMTIVADTPRPQPEPEKPATEGDREEGPASSAGSGTEPAPSSTEPAPSSTEPAPTEGETRPPSPAEGSGS